MQRPDVQKLVDEALARQRKQLLEYTGFSRNLRIEQIKASVKSPADKRAMAYLADEEFDWNDFMYIIEGEGCQLIISVSGKR